MKKKRAESNFKNLPTQTVKEYGSKGGRNQGKHNNPGNFANRSKKEVVRAAKKGGKASRKARTV